MSAATRASADDKYQDFVVLRKRGEAFLLTGWGIALRARERHGRTEGPACAGPASRCYQRRKARVALGVHVARKALVLGASAALVFGCTGTAGPEADQAVRSGEVAFQQSCAPCHGGTGAGDGPVGEALRTRPADLRRIAARRGGVFPEVEIRRLIDGRDPIVAHGPRDMPIWGHRFALDPSAGLATEGQARGQIELVIQYLETIQIP
jgi:mono/diheme cytochrome c family protein